MTQDELLKLRGLIEDAKAPVKAYNDTRVVDRHAMARSQRSLNAALGMLPEPPEPAHVGRADTEVDDDGVGDGDGGDAATPGEGDGQDSD